MAIDETTPILSLRTREDFAEALTLMAGAAILEEDHAAWALLLGASGTMLAIPDGESERIKASLGAAMARAAETERRLNAERVSHVVTGNAGDAEVWPKTGWIVRSVRMRSGHSEFITLAQGTRVEVYLAGDHRPDFYEIVFGGQGMFVEKEFVTFLNPELGRTSKPAVDVRTCIAACECEVLNSPNFINGQIWRLAAGAEVQVLKQMRDDRVNGDVVHAVPVLNPDYLLRVEVHYLSKPELRT